LVGWLVDCDVGTPIPIIVMSPTTTTQSTGAQEDRPGTKAAQKKAQKAVIIEAARDLVMWRDAGG